MIRKLRVFGIGLVLLAMVLGDSSNSSFGQSATPDRPNIVFILTDDQDAESIAFMPQLQSLLKGQGTTFMNFFVNVSLCCPSRASILRGQYSHNTEILTNSPPRGGFEAFHDSGKGNSTVATWLQAAGYRTVLLGKYLNGYPTRDNPTYVPPGWSEWYSPAGGNPYSNFNYLMNENGRLVAYGSRSQDYMTDVLAHKASDFIRRTAATNQPFFVYLATYAPHSPATPAPRHKSTFANAKAPRSPSFNETDVSDKPEYIRNRPLLNSREIAELDAIYRKRLQSLLAIDDMIASLIETLKATGQLENTYIFFTSDNGYHLGQHRLLQGKQTAYEEDIRVPLIVRGPGVPSGQTLDHITGNIDLAPTFAELAGAAVPDFVDGRSLVSLLGSSPPPQDAWRQAFLVQHWAVRASTQSSESARGVLEPPDQPTLFLAQASQAQAIPEFQAIRANDYLYVEYATGERELYDLQADPYELESLYAIAQPSLLTQLSARLSALKNCAAESCRAAEGAPLAVTLWGASKASTVATSEEPLYVVIMTHVEGDRGELEGSPTCASDLRYQTAPLPPRGQPPLGNSFAVDIVGTELLHEFLQRYTDSFGENPKLFIEPAGEFWQTEADPRYGNKLFQKHDYLALGYEFGIQGHGIYYSGQNFCWYISPKTEDGIRRKLTDLDAFAEKVFHNNQKVNAGLTLTPGAKIEGPAIGREQAEFIYDKVAHELGYRISFEDHDGHLEDEPAGINNSRSSYYLYEAIYDDGVRMLKIDFNGGVNASCSGNTPRCERPEEAIARLDRTLAARKEDPDPTRIYYFAFTEHSNGVWTDFHMAQTGQPMRGEGAGLVALMDAIQQRVNAGAKIKFVTPKELREIFERQRASTSQVSHHLEQVAIDKIYFQIALNINYSTDPIEQREIAQTVRRHLDLINKYGIKANYYFTGLAAEMLQQIDPALIELLKEKTEEKLLTLGHHGANRPPHPMPIERVKGQDWEEDVQAILDYESCALDPVTGTLDCSRTGGLKNMSENIFEEPIFSTGRFFQASILYATKLLGVKMAVGLQDNTGAPRSDAWFLGILNRPESIAIGPDSILRWVQSGASPLPGLEQRIAALEENRIRLISLLIHDHDFFRRRTVSQEEQIWQKYEEFIRWALARGYVIGSLEDLYNLAIDDRERTITKQELQKIAEFYVKQVEDSSPHYPPDYIDLNDDYFSLADVWQTLAQALAHYQQTGSLPDQVVTKDILGPPTLVNLVTAPMTVSADDILKSASVALASSLDLVPSTVRLDQAGIEINASEHLYLMAKEYLSLLSGDPLPVELFKINLISRNVEAIGPDPSDPRNGQADPLTKQQFWTFKPARWK